MVSQASDPGGLFGGLSPTLGGGIWGGSGGTVGPFGGSGVSPWGAMSGAGFPVNPGNAVGSGAAGGGAAGGGGSLPVTGDTTGGVDNTGILGAISSALHPAGAGANQSQIENGTDNLTGFAAQYNPNLLENIWQNPWAILPDVFKGINMTGAGYQGLRNLGADPLTLYNIMAGWNNPLDKGSGTANYTNWLASLYNQLGTVGGRAFSASDLLNGIFSPTQNSALKNIETAGDASQQMRTIFNLARDASNVGMNPRAATGYQAALARAGDAAMNDLMHTNSNSGAANVPMYQLLAQVAPNLVPR